MSERPHRGTCIPNITDYRYYLRVPITTLTLQQVDRDSALSSPVPNRAVATPAVAVIVAPCYIVVGIAAHQNLAVVRPGAGPESDMSRIYTFLVWPSSP